MARLSELGVDFEHWCFACGRLNPSGMHLDFEVARDRAETRYVGDQRHQGYDGTLHGGVVAALLDETMGWAIFHQGIWGVTARLTVTYRRPVPVGEELRVTGEVVRDRGRAIELHGTLVRASDGEILSAGDQVRALAESHALVTFFDGSTIEIEPEARITIEELGSSNGAVTIRLSQAIGHTWSSIVKFHDPASRYEIKTPALSATVRGTGLDVNVAADGTTTVAVTDGTAFVTANGVEVRVDGGTQTSASPGGTPAPAAPIPVPPAKLRFGMHSPAYLAVTLNGRSCGIVLPGPTVVPQTPGCRTPAPGLEPRLIARPNPVTGPYQLVIAPAGDGGDFTVTASGLARDTLVFNDTQAGSVKPGQILGTSLPVEPRSDGSLVSECLAPPGVNAPKLAAVPSDSESCAGTDAPAVVSLVTCSGHAAS